jgi:hypothetical protein
VFGVSLVSGGARVQVFERSICAPNGHFWRALAVPLTPSRPHDPIDRENLRALVTASSCSLYQCQ